jgi:hypothetical protein
MARLSRVVVHSYPHHVTKRGVRSMDVFHSEVDRWEYLGMLGEEIARWYGVAILVWCLMTNHVHWQRIERSWDLSAIGRGLLPSAEDDPLRELRQATGTGLPAGDGAPL